MIGKMAEHTTDSRSAWNGPNIGHVFLRAEHFSYSLQFHRQKIGVERRSYLFLNASHMALHATSRNFTAKRPECCLYLVVGFRPPVSFHRISLHVVFCVLSPCFGSALAYLWSVRVVGLHTLYHVVDIFSKP